MAATAGSFASTAALVGVSTHSSRRSRAKGRMMRPYWDCLKSPRSKSATAQISLAVEEKFGGMEAGGCWEKSPKVWKRG